MPIEVGCEATITHMVTGADTASTLGSGDVDVLATPAVVALCERAAVAAVGPSLGANETSVGVRVEIDHIAPTVPGLEVSATAKLRGIDGRRLKFDVEVSDRAGVVARVTHIRVVVDRDRFMHGADARGG
jgi:fluoroacetyl-CoA thioesterase